MIKKIVSAVAISSALSTALFADIANISRDGMGDFLIAPVYIAKGDVCSNIKVFNTNETSSILAKVAFRERISSQEVDFPIFLSPGDVWEGKVCQSSNGVILTSDDDSNHPAVKSVLVNGKNLTAQSRSAGHTNIDFTKGYVEIYPVAEFNEGSNAKVNKQVLVERWNALIKGDTSNPKLRQNGVDGYSLSGVVSFETDGTETASIPMLAFKGADDKQVTGSAIAYSNDTSPELLLGTDKEHQILKALQKRTTSFYYDNAGKNQYINLTFPFGYVDNQVRTYKITVRDMSEDKDRIEKVVIFSPRIAEKDHTIKNEVASISIEDIIAHTSNPAMFEKGMIQIKDITNDTDVQLGEGKIASFIAVKITKGTALTNNGEKVTDVANAIYVPSK
jgi:hypothetical protein